MAEANKLKLAGCVILNESGELLLLHRNLPNRKQWETPGGKLKNGENPEHAAVREIKEELGVDVRIIKKLGTKNFTEDEFVMKYTWYLAVIVSGDPYVVEKEKFNDLQYFSWQKLTKMMDELSPNTHNLVEAYFNKKINL